MDERLDFRKRIELLTRSLSERREQINRFPQAAGVIAIIISAAGALLMLKYINGLPYKLASYTYAGTAAIGLFLMLLRLKSLRPYVLGVLAAGMLAPFVFFTIELLTSFGNLTLFRQRDAAFTSFALLMFSALSSGLVYAAVHTRAVFPGNKPLRLVSGIFGVLGLCFSMLCFLYLCVFGFFPAAMLVFRIPIYISHALPGGVMLCMCAQGLCALLSACFSNRDRAIFQARLAARFGRIAFFAGLLYLVWNFCRILMLGIMYSDIAGWQLYDILTFTLTITTIALLPAVALSDALGQTLFRSWSKSAETELSRMEQEIKPD